MNYSSLDDRRLVALASAGDGAAFRQIVERYQTMVCALAFSACGDVGRSEDLAQEVFISAWKQLSALREPEKLRSWLAGITRNQANNFFRVQGRTPTARAGLLSAEIPADGASPRDHAITTDETALLWSVLAGIPENYREPMVLYYREQRSVSAVAATLEISEDAVRQRLARGRALLSERMSVLVEEALVRSTPASGFVAAVMLAVPLGVGSSVIVAAEAGATGGALSKTATSMGVMAGAVAKGGVAVKAIAVFASLPALLNGATDYLDFRAKHRALETVEQRRQVARTYLIANAAMGVVVLGVFCVPAWLPSMQREMWPTLALIAVTGFAFAILLRSKAKLERDLSPAVPLFSKEKIRSSSDRGFQYRSATMWWGLPLIHVRLGSGQGWKGPVLKAWIAIGDGRSFGVFFASGLLAVAPVNFGLLVSLGGLGLGAIALGFGTIGVVSAGWMTEGMFGVGGYAARGGLVAAGSYGQGVIATFAPTAKQAGAELFFRDSVFFHGAHAIREGALYAAWFAWVVPLVLMSWQLWRGQEKAPRR